MRTAFNLVSTTTYGKVIYVPTKSFRCPFRIFSFPRCLSLIGFSWLLVSQKYPYSATIGEETKSLYFCYAWGANLSFYDLLCTWTRAVHFFWWMKREMSRNLLDEGVQICFLFWFWFWFFILQIDIPILG